MTIEFRPLSKSLGAEAVGVNAADDHSDETIAEIRDAWLRYNILLFRNQDLTIDQQKAFARRFGKLILKKPTSATPYIQEHPEVTVLSNIRVNGKDLGNRPDASFGDAWHSDFSYLAEPAGGSFFYAKEVPETGGDDTWYANLTKAYAALPETMKGKLQNLRWGYSQVRTFERHAPEKKPLTEDEKRNLPDVSHPFVRTHPETGNRALFVGILDTREATVDDMAHKDGIKFIEKLKTFATQPQFTYRHQWRQGDSILWDNRCTLHRATNFPETNGPRLCYRVTLEGGVPY